jgi:hypothetical protein
MPSAPISSSNTSLRSKAGARSQPDRTGLREDQALHASGTKTQMPQIIRPIVDFRADPARPLRTDPPVMYFLVERDGFFCISLPRFGHLCRADFESEAVVSVSRWGKLFSSGSWPSLGSHQLLARRRSRKLLTVFEGMQDEHTAHLQRLQNSNWP